MTELSDRLAILAVRMQLADQQFDLVCILRVSTWRHHGCTRVLACAGVCGVMACAACRHADIHARMYNRELVRLLRNTKEGRDHLEMIQRLTDNRIQIGPSKEDWQSARRNVLSRGWAGAYRGQTSRSDPATGRTGMALLHIVQSEVAAGAVSPACWQGLRVPQACRRLPSVAPMLGSACTDRCLEGPPYGYRHQSR